MKFQDYLTKVDVRFMVTPDPIASRGGSAIFNIYELSSRARQGRSSRSFHSYKFEIKMAGR
jgi:hypothetical protein